MVNEGGQWTTTASSTPSTRRTKRQLTNRKRTTKREATYRAWRNMLARCFNPKHVSFKDYGGRGISVSELFVPSERLPSAKAFKNFISYVGLRPTAQHSLDRYPDVNGHYVPGNIRWATNEEQASNKRGSKTVVHPTSGLPVAPAALARELGVSYHALRQRLIDQGKW